MELDDDEEEEEEQQQPAAAQPDGMDAALGSFYASLGLEGSEAGGSGANTGPSSPAPQPTEASSFRERSRVVEAPSGSASPCGSNSPGPSWTDQEDREKKRKKVGY